MPIRWRIVITASWVSRQGPQGTTQMLTTRCCVALGGERWLNQNETDLDVLRSRNGPGSLAVMDMGVGLFLLALLRPQRRGRTPSLHYPQSHAVPSCQTGMGHPHARWGTDIAVAGCRDESPDEYHRRRLAWLCDWRVGTDEVEIQAPRP